MKLTIIYTIIALIILAIIIFIIIYSYDAIANLLHISFWEAILLFAILKTVFWIIYSLLKK